MLQAGLLYKHGQTVVLAKVGGIAKTKAYTALMQVVLLAFLAMISPLVGS